MSFFNNEDIFTATETIPAIEGLQYDVDFGGAANIAMESYEDQLNIVRAIHAADIAELRCKYKIRSVQESYGDVDEAEAELHSVQEASVKEIFNAIKEAIKKFFGKIATFFKSLYDKFVVMNKSNKSFAEKYTPIVEDLGSYITSVDVLGYPYKSSGKGFATILKQCETGVKDAEEQLKMYNDVVDKAIDAWNAAAKQMDAERNIPNDTNKVDVDNIKLGMLKTIGSKANKANVESGSFAELAYSAVRGIDTKDKATVSYTSANLVAELNVLGNIDLSVLKKIEGMMTKGFNKIIATIDKAEKAYTKLPDGHKGKNALVSEANAFSKKMTAIKSVNLTYLSVMRNCAADYSNQIKTATVKAIAMGRDAKKKAEKSE